MKSASVNANQLRQALKEWKIAIEALEAGKTIMLLRKGGIRETSGRFQANYRQVWLYPTYEHQKPELLKPEYASAVKPVESGWHPATVSINSYADITEVLPVKDRDRVRDLQAYHIWNERAIEERLNWKSDRPLFVLLLRVYRLAEARTLQFDKTYRGCRSWLELAKPLLLTGLNPVFDDDSYQKKVREITNIINN